MIRFQPIWLPGARQLVQIHTHTHIFTRQWWWYPSPGNSANTDILHEQTLHLCLCSRTGRRLSRSRYIICKIRRSQETCEICNLGRITKSVSLFSAVRSACWAQVSSQDSHIFMRNRWKVTAALCPCVCLCHLHRHETLDLVDLHCWSCPRWHHLPWDAL